MIKLDEKVQKQVLSLHIIFFYIVWSVYALFLSNPIKAISPYIGVGIKLLVWTLPVCIIIGFIYKVNIFEYLKLKSGNWKKILYYTAIVGAIFIAWDVISCVFIFKSSFSLNKGFSTWLSAVILIGFTEEIVFRGFILQGLANLMKFRYANIITSILFVLAHFPGWYKNGLFNSQYKIVSNICFIFAFALVNGWLLKKTNSLWSCIFLHTLNNFITVGFGL